MRVRAIAPLLLLIVSSACGGAGLFRQYEYEEDIHLSLDGSATVYVNSSLAALNALRGTAFDLSTAARPDLQAVRAYYEAPGTHVSWVRQSRRNNRRFVHLRLEVGDMNKLSASAPFAWSAYKFRRDGDLFVYTQAIGPSAGRDVGGAGWKGGEVVAFRLHLPSKITYQNTPDLRRGNILVWEQPLAERLKGTPLALDARMETQSILYRTLWLFAATFAVVAVAFVALIWWIFRRGAEPAAGQV